MEASRQLWMSEQCLWMPSGKQTGGAWLFAVFQHCREAVLCPFTKRSKVDEGLMDDSGRCSLATSITRAIRAGSPR